MHPQDRPPCGSLLRVLACVFLASAVLLGAVQSSAQAQEQRPASPPEESVPDGASELSAEDDQEGNDGEGDDPESMPRVFAEWLEEVSVLITDAERAVFESLKKDYQRDAFIRKFWEVRDPYPESARNELKERWDERVQFARGNFEGLRDARSQILLLHGEPARRVEVRCTTTRIPAEIWLYTRLQRSDVRVLLVFIKRRGTGRASLWQPGRGRLDLTIEMARSCINGKLLEDVAESLIAQGGDYDIKLSRVLTKPFPNSREWLSSFTAESTDLPEEAETFDATTRFDFLGRNQSRTVVQVSLGVDPKQAALSDLAGYRSYDFQVLGEIVNNDQLLEGFRYKFGFPLEDEPRAQSEIPMAFQRYLRPGPYNVVLRVEDLNSGRFYRQEFDLEVPKVDQEYVSPALQDTETARVFAEAADNALFGDDSVRLRRPTGFSLRTGFVRFNAEVTGDAIERVVFILDDREILTKTKPPYNVEVDLGEFPKHHDLRVEGLDANGEVVAVDEIAVNAGGSRFSLRLVEPRRSQRFDHSLRATATVEVPDGKQLDRVEFFLNETRIATLFQEPFVQPMQLSGGGRSEYVRAVAFLDDGNSAEDLVFVNAAEVLEEVEVQFVELYASVTDRNGRPLSGLEIEDFEIQEDGEAQKILRLKKVDDMPIHIGILIDNSASMKGALDTTRVAALGFLENVVQPRDRAAVVTFNRFPRLAVKMTNDLTTLGGGLAGLTAEGQTALYDSVMFTLYYFAGVSGQKSVLILSDGKDEVSRFSFDETLEYAKRAGVTIYSVGLGIPEGNARRKLANLADETGGRSYFIKRPSDLEEIYTQIERDLRSQYEIAYQSTNTALNEQFRRITVKARVPGAEVRTMTGYYP